jgi:hypothetical protein
MLDYCKICNCQSPEQNHFWTVHKITLSNYIVSYYPKVNKLTGKQLKFKSIDQYFTQDFDSRQELKEWSDKNPDKVNDYLIEYLINRKKFKQIKYLPSQFETKGLIFPSISYILYHNKNILNILSQGAGLELKYDYNQKLIFNNKQLDIIIDTREQKPLDFKEYTVNKLQQGDYKASNSSQNITVDRKDLTDFIGCMSGGYERLNREIERAKKDGEYLVLLLETNFNELLTFKEKRWLKFVKATSEFILHRTRDLLQKHDNLQIICVENRAEAKRIISKLFNLENPIKTVDLQYFIDTQKF